MDLKDYILDILKLIKSNTQTKKGLIGLIIIEFLIIYNIPLQHLKGILSVPPKFYPFVKWLEVVFEYPPITKFILFLFVLIITLIVWSIKSGRIVLWTKKYKVGIALKYDNTQSQEILEKTFQKVEKKLDLLGLLSKYKIQKIGTDLFSNNEEVEKYSKKHGFNIIIHGSVSTETKNGKKIFSMKDFAFTYNYQYSSVKPEFKKLILQDIKLMLSYETWIIEEENTYDGLEKISNNLLEILLSVVAISTISNKKQFDNAVRLIESVLPVMETNTKSARIALDLKNKKAKIPIELIRAGRLRSILLDSYSLIGDEKVDLEDYKSALEISLKSIKFGANKYDQYERLAYCYYMLGNIENAKKYTEEMNKIQPNTPSYLVNKAFFSILEDKQQDVICYYNELYRKKTDKALIENVIKFLNREKKTQNKIGIDYGIAFLTYNYLDKVVGKELLDKFSHNVDIQDYKDEIDNILNKNVKQNPKRKHKKKRKR
jgi:tetratricopeptide (TPR) repeat protein